MSGAILVNREPLAGPVDIAPALLQAVCDTVTFKVNVRMRSVEWPTRGQDREASLIERSTTLRMI